MKSINNTKVGCISVPREEQKYYRLFLLTVMLMTSFTFMSAEYVQDPWEDEGSEISKEMY